MVDIVRFSPDVSAMLPPSLAFSLFVYSDVMSLVSIILLDDGDIIDSFFCCVSWEDDVAMVVVAVTLIMLLACDMCRPGCTGSGNEFGGELLPLSLSLIVPLSVMLLIDGVSSVSSVSTRSSSRLMLLLLFDVNVLAFTLSRAICFCALPLVLSPFTFSCFRFDSFLAFSLPAFPFAFPSLMGIGEVDKLGHASFVCGSFSLTSAPTFTLVIDELTLPGAFTGLVVVGEPLVGFDDGV